MLLNLRDRERDRRVCKQRIERLSRTNRISCNRRKLVIVCLCLMRMHAKGGFPSQGPAGRVVGIALQCPGFLPKRCGADALPKTRIRVFEAQYPARRCPCLRFDKTPRGAHRKNSRSGRFATPYPCKTLSFSTTCRFIPAHGQTPIWLLIGQLREV